MILQVSRAHRHEAARAVAVQRVGDEADPAGDPHALLLPPLLVHALLRGNQERGAPHETQ